MATSTKIYYDIRKFILIFGVLLLFITPLLHAQWKQCNGPLGGYITCFATSGNLIFAGTDDGGVYRSTNNGEEWVLVNKGLPYGRIVSMTMKGTTLFIGTEGGIFRSSDSGESWIATNNGLPTKQTIYSLVSNETSLFAGSSSSGIYKSTDNGENWIAINNGIKNKFIGAIATNGTSIFIGTGANLTYQSTDNGENWNEGGNGLTETIKDLVVINDTLFAASSKGIFRSSDNGKFWINVNSISANSLAANGTILYAGTYNGVLKSEDNGNNWVKVNNGITKTYPEIEALVITNTSIFAGSGTSHAGIYRSTDNGENWTEVNHGLAAQTVRSIQFYGNRIFAGTEYSAGIYMSTDNGENWTPGKYPYYNVNSIAVDETNTFIGTGNGVFQNTDFDGDWIDISPKISEGQGKSIILNESALFAWDYSFVYRSFNNGKNWEVLKTDTSERYVQVLFAKGNFLFIGTDSGGVYRSDDVGDNLQKVDILQTDKSISALFMNGSTLFAGTRGDGIYGSTNNGDSWVELNTGLTSKFMAVYQKV